MKATRHRNILHLDLDPFFVSVERSLDPTLRGRPVVVGGGEASGGVVAAVSDEARALGVGPGQPLARARELCPGAAFRPGDFDTYARVSEEVTSLLLGCSRRVERPSVDEAYADLTPESPGSAAPVALAEALKDELQRRLGLDASLGLAGTRVAARVASWTARPRGLLVVLPGYDASFVARRPVRFLPDLPEPLGRGLERAGIRTLGELAGSDPQELAAVVGASAAARLREAARGEGEEPVAVAAPPVWIQEEATVRDRRSDRAALETLLEGLVARACRRLRPAELGAGNVVVEVRREGSTLRRSEELQPRVGDEATLLAVAHNLALPLLEPAQGIRGLTIRLTRLGRSEPQVPLFPTGSHFAARR